jgi:mono/diheme cytochrome c family protein
MNWIRCPIGLLGVVVALLAGSQAWAQDAGNRGAGLVLARQICSECHAIEKAQAHSLNADAPSFETIANVPGMTATALSVALQRSHQTMPNVMLNANELSDIIAYILSLQRAN